MSRALAASRAGAGPAWGSAWRYLRSCSPAALLAAPLLYLGLLPILLLDLFTSLYQAACFRAYGISRVRRRGYIVLDRHRLPYLSWIERLNCDYCAYFNGVLAFAREVAGRTELHFCPIRNAAARRGPHGHYGDFGAYGDAAAYAKAQREQTQGEPGHGLDPA